VMVVLHVHTPFYYYSVLEYCLRDQQIKKTCLDHAVLTSDYIVLLFVLCRSILSNPFPLPLLTADGSHRGTLPSYTFGSTGSRVRQRDRFKQDRVTHYGDDSPGPCQYVKSLFMIHVGGTRCVTSSTDQIGKYMLNVEYEHVFILFLFDV
jgi:hypothetical protein